MGNNPQDDLRYFVSHFDEYKTKDYNITFDVSVTTIVLVIFYKVYNFDFSVLMVLYEMLGSNVFFIWLLFGNRYKMLSQPKLDGTFGLARIIFEDYSEDSSLKVLDELKKSYKFLSRNNKNICKLCEKAVGCDLFGYIKSLYDEEEDMFVWRPTMSELRTV